MSASDREKIFLDFRRSLGFPDKLDCAENATKQFQTLHSMDFLKSIDATKANDPKANSLKSELKSVLALNKETAEGMKNFKDRIQATNDIIKDKTTAYKFSIFTVTDKIHIAKSYAINAIKYGQAKEQTALDDYIKTNDFNIDATEAGFDPNQLQTQLIDQLKERHKTEIIEFEKTVNQELIAIHQANQKEIERILIMNECYKKNKDLQSEINELIKLQGATVLQGNEAESVVEFDNKSARFRGIPIEKLKDIMSLTGNKIIPSADGKTFTMQISTHRYWILKNPESAIQKDMRSLAQTVRAKGNDTINFQINVDVRQEDPEEKIKDEAVANLMARKAYTEALRAGFKHEDITINLNGTAYKGDKLLTLFNEHPNDLERAQHDAKLIQDMFKRHSVVEHDNLARNTNTDPEQSNFDTAYKEKYQQVKSTTAGTPVIDDTPTTAEKSPTKP